MGGPRRTPSCPQKSSRVNPCHDSEKDKPGDKHDGFSACLIVATTLSLTRRPSNKGRLPATLMQPFILARASQCNGLLFESKVHCSECFPTHGTFPGIAFLFYTAGAFCLVYMRDVVDSTLLVSVVSWLWNGSEMQESTEEVAHGQPGEEDCEKEDHDSSSWFGLLLRTHAW